jgi:predicted heme/steroid binding protein
MTKCTNGERAAHGQPYGCLTMFNTSTNTVTMLESYLGDLTGIAGVTGLHKVYVAQGGQVYIYRTTDGASLDNQYVTVTGTAYDVAYMDGLTDGNNTVY